MNTIESIQTKLRNKVKNIYEHNPHRMYADVDKKDIAGVFKFVFKDSGLRFCTLSACDLPNGIELLYHFSEDKTGIIISFRVLLEDKNKLEIESVGKDIPAAAWIEREVWELFGVTFTGHPNLKHLILEDNWPKCNYPLRKDQEEKK